MLHKPGTTKGRYKASRMVWHDVDPCAVPATAMASPRIDVAHACLSEAVMTYREYKHINHVTMYTR